MKKLILLQLLFFIFLNAKTFNINDYSYHKLIERDVTNDGLSDKVYILQKNTNTNAKIFIEEKISNNFKPIYETNYIIPYINTWLKYEMMVDSSNNLYNSQDEGVSFTINTGNVNNLILETIKDGYLDRFKLYFEYQKNSNTFKLKKIYFLSFQEDCSHVLNRIYELKSKKFDNILLENFNANEMYDFLYKDPMFARKDIQMIKITSNEIKSIYEKLKNNKKINYYDIFDDCNLEDNIYSKYFYDNNIELSNNISYYFQKAGYYNEAILLLEKIIKKFPNRTVAYLNLADAYNGINNKERAKENYEKYVNLMKQDKKENKIPQRVLEYK
jgi:hypothetical protein